MDSAIFGWQVAGWNVWLLAFFVALTLVVANLLAKLSTRCRRQRIQELATKLATENDFSSSCATDGAKTPITIVTGFLGSGKTTLVNEILTKKYEHNKKIVVIENEFGSISIDHKLIESTDEEASVIVLKNGCMCCSADGPGDELERSLAKLVDLLDDGQFDHVVIETSGLANPGPLISMLFSSHMARSRYVLDGVVAVVDCKHIMWHLGGELHGSVGQRAARWVLSGAPRTREAQHQLLAADVILLNKIDLVSPSELQAVQDALGALNSCAQLRRCQRSQVDTAELLQLAAFDLAHTARSAAGVSTAQYNALSSLEGVHSSGTGSSTLLLPGAAVLKQEPLMQWLQGMLQQHWRQLYRVKGILPVRCGSGRVRDFVVQGVHAELYGEFAGEGGASEQSMPTAGQPHPSEENDGDHVHSEWLSAGECSHHAATAGSQQPPGAQQVPVLVLIGQGILPQQRAEWQKQLLACCED